MLETTPNRAGSLYWAVVNFDPCPGFVADCGQCAGHPDISPTKRDRAVYRICDDVGCRLRRRRSRNRRSAPLDQCRRVQRDLCAVPFPAWSEHCQSLNGGRRAAVGVGLDIGVMALFAVGGALRRVRSDVCGMRTDRHASLCREPPDGAANLRAGQKSSRPRWFRSRSD